MPAGECRATCRVTAVVSYEIGECCGAYGGREGADLHTGGGRCDWFNRCHVWAALSVAYTAAGKPTGIAVSELWPASAADAAGRQYWCP